MVPVGPYTLAVLGYLTEEAVAGEVFWHCVF